MSKSSQILREELFHRGELGFSCLFKNNGLFKPHVHWFAYARQALKFGLEALGISHTDKVLVPAYICNVIESSFSSLSIGISYYDIKKDLSPDFEDIERKIEKKTKGLLCVNYFGFPAPIDRIRAFCQENQLFFIENNAHGFLSIRNGQRLGSFGDISITSVRKSFPLMHGALLQINPKLRLNIPSSSRNNFNIRESSLRYMIRYVKRFLLNRDVFPFPRLRKKQLSKKQSSWDNAMNSMPDRLMEVKLHFLVPLTARFLCYEALRKHRLDKYEMIMRFLEKQTMFSGETLFKNLPDGTIPLQIPYLLRDKNMDNRQLLTSLSRKGIEAFYWPDLPGEVNRNPHRYPMANYLRNHCIHFPV